MKYKILKKCRLCDSSKLKIFLDFNKMPLAGGFLSKSEIRHEELYPMAMQQCRSCSSVQVDTVIPLDKLFKKYFYFSSNIKTLVNHFYELSNIIKKKYLPEGGSILEIGCNDGVFLNHIVKNKNIKCIGVDPAKNVIKRITNKKIQAYNEPFNLNLAKKINNKFPNIEVILSSFSFGHIDDMKSVIKGIDLLLSDSGVFIFEIYYLGTVIDELQYDMMYHEHMSYYTIKALNKFLSSHNLKLFKIEKIKLRSGSLRFFAKRTINIKQSEHIKKHINLESSRGYNKFSYLIKYKNKIDKTKKDLISLITKLKNQGNTIYGYGASGRGTIIMNYCNLDEKFIDYVIDDAPQKRNMFTPGTHVKIISWEDMGKKIDFPNYLLLFAWPFASEIISKRKEYQNNGGKFIIPLPSVKSV